MKVMGTYFGRVKKDGSVSIPKSLRFAIEDGFVLEYNESFEGLPYLRVSSVDDGRKTKDGSIKIPEYMRDDAMLKDKVMIVGAQDRIEIWNPLALKTEFILYRQMVKQRKNSQ